MDRAAAEEMQARLVNTVHAGWTVQDPEVRVSSVLRANNMIDLTVVSERFRGLSSMEREALFWPVFAPVPRADLVYMTYCLLLTPEEAARQFPAELQAPLSDQDNSDDWTD